MSIISSMIFGFLFVNMIIAVITVFHEKRDISTIWAWLVVLLLLPGLGFLVYWFFGAKISKKKIYRLQTQDQLGFEQIAINQANFLKANTDSLPIEKTVAEMIEMFINGDQAMVSRGNSIEVITDGQKKFDLLFEELKKAKHHINLEYFSINDDVIGNKLVQLLTEKAKQGVEVRVLYDQYGSHGHHKKMYSQLEKAGGIIIPFLSRKFQLLALRVNFRNHRKLAIIDGKVGFIGGFNVGDQYIGSSEKFGYWRDTHLKLKGDAVLAIQSRFLMDWNATAEYNEIIQNTHRFFPDEDVSNGKEMAQIISSGPDDNMEQIKQGYIKMFSSAKKSIIIQTPYFIPDAVVLQTLQIAILSGVKVQILIPDKPDHPFVYRATEYYAKQLINMGAEVYKYCNGFTHSKVVIIDEKLSSVGSANMDIRSFALNFEVNCFIYSKDIAKKLIQEFEKDIEVSQLLTKDYFNSQTRWMKFKQHFSRLLSPLL